MEKRKPASRGGNRKTGRSSSKAGIGEAAVTMAMLKRVTGEFDPESIRNLDLSDAGLSDLSGIQECVNLADFTARSNSITSLAPLKGLAMLRKIDVIENKLKSLDSIAGSESIQHLNLQMNAIPNLDSLKPLATLPSLRKLNLKNADGTSSNPVCSDPDYRSTILSLLPKLEILDGERLKHSRDGPSPLDAIDSAMSKKTGGLTVPPVKPILSGATIDDCILDAASFLSEGEQKLKGEIVECKKLNANATAMIQHFK